LFNRLAQRLDKIEAAQTPTETRDIGQRVLAARLAPPAPTHTRAELETLAQGDGQAARIARGWLRIGFVHRPDFPSAQRRQPEQIEPDTVLPAMAGYLSDKPLEFVLFAFDWGTDRALQVVKLPDEFRMVFDSEFGPDLWACELLEDVAASVRERAFDGRQAVDAIRMAVSSGHGIGKSATTAWIVNWVMSTRPNARGVVTANTAAQLETKTWAELAKWTKRSIFAEWFDVTTGRGSMKMAQRERPESWRCDAQTSREENSESFAGLHAADSTPFYIFDEASAIPAKIWEVAEGGMTDGEPMWFTFGNPTRTGTKFHEAFNGQRHRWATRTIDSRQVQITNKQQIADWVTDYGEDSDFVKVRVRGIFPSASSLQFIGRDLVDSAAARELPNTRRETVVVGVDPARFGDDSSVIWTRTGRDARTWPPIRLRGVDTMTLASRVAEHVNLQRSAGRFVIVNVDGGGVGGGVIDRLRSMGFDVNEVQFGGKAMDTRKYANRRAEIWGVMRDWLAGGCVPKDEDLASDLTNVEYGFTSNDQILLEKKEDMKRRGLASPDSADALAITFAVPVPMPMSDDMQSAHTQTVTEYDPYAYANCGHDPHKASAYERSTP
jgi:hypothetical protein